MKDYFKRVFSLAGILLVQVQFLAAQVPDNLPAGNPEPVPITPGNILIFIVLPVLLFIFYIWWLRDRKKKREEALKKKAEEQEKEESKS